jgi:hypothetical protein
VRRPSLAWRYWSCLDCQRTRLTVAWWAQEYACTHGSGYGFGNRTMGHVANPLLERPDRIQRILESQ